MDLPITVKCYSCNLPIAGKWKEYQRLIKTYRREEGRAPDSEIMYLTTDTKVTAEGRALNDLGLTRECCRRHLLTHPGV
jgi:DNA-directed RNA polymerase I, II, and III subunit RPABC5